VKTIRAILKLISDRMSGKSARRKRRGKFGKLRKLRRRRVNSSALNTGSRNFSTCRELLVAQFTKSGVYRLTSAKNPKHSFLAYCDQKTAGGGWMLAFKQSHFQSGSVKHDKSLYGSMPLLSTKFNSSSLGSIFNYHKPKHMLFRSSIRTNWFTTPFLRRGRRGYQYWDISPTPRYCYYPKNHPAADITVSKSWNTKKMAPLWPDVNIQLMDASHPDISAVTIGRMVFIQKGPDCMEPHCHPDRHGRYNGQCQNGKAGIGNWMIFTR